MTDMAATKTTSKKPGPDQVIDAALRLADDRRWRDISLGDIAAEAGITLPQLYPMFASKGAILRGLSKRIDEQIIAGTDADASQEPTRDRLFDILIRRFEALKPHRMAIASIVRDVATAPPLGLAAGCTLMRSMAWSLEMSGVSSSGPCGLVRTKGLAAIYLSALAVFLRDDSEDLAKTMANLDRNLGRADDLIGRFRFPGRRRGEEAAAA